MSSTIPYYTFGDTLPLPMRGPSLLVEVEYEKIESALYLAHDADQLDLATVRAVSDTVPAAVREILLPEGNGSIGRTILAGSVHFAPLYLGDYELFDLEPPSDDNDHRLLAFLDLSAVTAYVDDDGETAGADTGFLPFVPMGRRVFVDFEQDDVAPLFKDGELNDDALVQKGQLFVPEAAEAARNNRAVVIGVGAAADGVSVGDRVVVSRNEYAIEYDGKAYFYVGSPDDLVCKVGVNEAAAGNQFLQISDDHAPEDCPTPGYCMSQGCQERCEAAGEEPFVDPITDLSPEDFELRVTNQEQA